MSDASRPRYQAARAVAEYAAFYGQDEPETMVRELVAEELDMSTNPNGW